MMLTKNYLKSKGVRASATFIKSSHFLTHILSGSLKVIGAYEKIAYSDSFRIYPRRDIVRKLFRLWRFLDTLSIAVKFFLTVYIPSCTGFTVLIEEGLMMTEYTYCIIFPRYFKTRNEPLPLMSNLLGWIRKRNHVNFVLDANANELIRRRRTRSFRQNELSEYVILQKEWMRCLSPQDTVFIGTTGKSIKNVHEKIVAILETYECTKTEKLLRGNPQSTLTVN
jgi:hypothetical protein